MLRLPAALATALAVVALAAACGSNGTGVDACKTIEEARCRQLPSCPNVQVSPPIWYTTGSAVDACIRYYDTACLHGLAIGSNPGTAQLNACVAVINSGSCDVVAAPESDPSGACAWLIPPADLDAGDGAVETGPSDAADASAE